MQNAWHLKDWVRNDEEIPKEDREEIVKSAEANDSLRIWHDLANGTKHLRLHSPQRDATLIPGQNVTIFASQNRPNLYTHTVTLDSDQKCIAQDLAEDIAEEWALLLLRYELGL